LIARRSMPICWASSIRKPGIFSSSARNCRLSSPVYATAWPKTARKGPPGSVNQPRKQHLAGASPAGESRGLDLASAFVGCFCGMLRRDPVSRSQYGAIGSGSVGTSCLPILSGARNLEGAAMARSAALPILTAESGLTRYLEEIRRFPMLEPQEEYMLAKRWREHGDRDAAHRLVTSHLRLVAKIAMGYRGYGLPIAGVISEGNVGLMQAVKRFEPEKGFRLATYAMWWIKASIQEYILRSWSLVKMGTTANQKKLFFNLRKAKSKISALEEGDMRPDQVK